VIYGAAITDPTSASIFSALTDHWIHTGGPKKEAARYHIPSAFFIPGTRLSMLLQAVENASPPLVQTAELCGLYYSHVVRRERKGEGRRRKREGEGGREGSASANCGALRTLLLTCGERKGGELRGRGGEGGRRQRGNGRGGRGRAARVAMACRMRNYVLHETLLSPDQTWLERLPVS
jgi:hypothetical protein